MAYQWHYTKKIISDPPRRSRVFELLIKPVDAPFIEYNITQKQTWEEFVASVAGIINLYLGLGGIAIITLSIKLIKLYRKIFNKKKFFNVMGNGMNMELARRNVQDKKQQLDALFIEIDTKFEEVDKNVKYLENYMVRF